MWHQQVYVVDVADGVGDPDHRPRATRTSIPTWLPDGRTLAALGHRFPARAGSRNDIWLFAADGSEADGAAAATCRAGTTSWPAPAMGSDLTPGEEPPHRGHGRRSLDHVQRPVRRLVRAVADLHRPTATSSA